MCPEKHHRCTVIDRFSLKQRILMQAGWIGFTAVGFWGIYRQSTIWAFLYAAFGLVGFALIVLPSLCAHCPYPAQYNTCLFLPPGLVRRFYPYRGPHMSTSEKAATLAVLAGVVIMPHFWLARDVWLLAVFWLIGLPALAAFPLHYCRRCRHTGCPLSKAGTPS